jgi:ABC-type transport system involved in cytochrome bd biosynthesis fused ATPase/permease subunit
MRLHFKQISDGVAGGHTKIARSIADRVEPPASQKKVDEIERYFLRSVNALLMLLFSFSIYGMATSHFTFEAFVIALVLLLLVRIIIIPVFKRAMKRRILEVSTFHNRLMASSKQIEKS